MTLEKASQELIAAIQNLMPGARPSMVDVDLAGADLHGQQLNGENMSGANLAGANLSGCNLQGAIFRDTDLPGANLRDADLTAANMHGADLCGADLSGAEGLRSVDWEYAFGDASTIWPDGFDPADKIMIVRSDEDGTVAEPEKLTRRVSARLREEAAELYERMRARFEKER